MPQKSLCVLASTAAVHTISSTAGVVVCMYGSTIMLPVSR